MDCSHPIPFRKQKKRKVYLAESAICFYYLNLTYNNQVNLFIMNFGPLNICPPLCYFLYMPPEFCISAQNFQNPLEVQLQSRPTPHGFTPEDRIIVTCEDLLEEGYEQTKKAWTEEQDELLLKLCVNKYAKFQEIAAFMPHRNAKMCYSRYRRLTNQSKDCWSRAENEKLKSFVEIYGENNWRAFEQHFPNRNYKQLKDHYENYLRPDLLNMEWTVEDDLLLIRLLNQHGKNWKLIEKFMPSRSRNQLKNRYFGRIKRINARKVDSLKGEETSSGNKLSLQPI